MRKNSRRASCPIRLRWVLLLLTAFLVGGWIVGTKLILPSLPGQHSSDEVRHLNIIVPLRASHIEANFLTKLRHETGKLRHHMYFVAAQTLVLDDRLKELIDRPDTSLLRHPPKEPLPTYADLFNYALATVPESAFVLSLAPTHVPMDTSFLSDMMGTFQTFPSVKLVGCRSLVQRDGDLVVSDAGYSTSIGRDAWGQSKTYMVREFNGFNAKDSRAASPRSVLAVDPFCMLSRFETLSPLSGFRQLKGLSLLDQVLNGYLDDEGMNEKMTKLRLRVAQLEEVMDNLKVSELNDGGEDLRSGVRVGYTAVTDATELWESITKQRWARAKIDEIDSNIGPEETEYRKKLTKMTIPQRLHDLAAKLEALSELLKKIVHDRTLAASEEESGWDLSLILRTSPVGDLDTQRELVVVSNATVSIDLEAVPLAVRTYIEKHSLELIPASVVVSGSFSEQWERQLRMSHPSRQGTDGVPLKIYWDMFCCSCCGFANEIVHFVWPLQKVHDVSVVPGPECFCPGFPGAVQSAMTRMHTTRETYTVARSSEDEIVVWISHTDPAAYNNDVFRHRAPNYIVGRSMYEFTKIDGNWVDGANHDCDEIWVPAVWVKKMFAASGVDPKKMVIIPEAVDTYFFDPKAQSKLPLPPVVSDDGPKWRVWCNKEAPRKAYKFFSNFKWEPRKGWDIMLDAYFTGFTAKDQVSLYILTHIWFSGGPETYGDPHNTTYLRLEVEDFIRAKYGVKEVNLENYPHFCFLCAHLSEVQVAEVYNSVDAFVLPTRGEGWGLPAIQAMSMGLPTITTNWGGQMEFLTAKNSFRIPVDAVEEIPKDSVYRWRLGKKWAQPSMTATRRYMKLVVEKPEYAKRVGAVARKWIVKHFSEEALLKIVDKRLREIKELVLAKRKTSQKTGE